MNTRTALGNLLSVLGRSEGWAQARVAAAIDEAWAAYRAASDAVEEPRCDVCGKPAATITGGGARCRSRQGVRAPGLVPNSLAVRELRRALWAYVGNDECINGLADDPDPECECAWCNGTRLYRETADLEDRIARLEAGTQKQGRSIT